MAKITFKAKTYPIDISGTDHTAIDFKKTVSRKDCDLKAHQHAYYNSQLFPAMLNRAYRAAIGEYTEWATLDALPAGVTVDASKFLAVVTVELPDNFR